MRQTLISEAPSRLEFLTHSDGGAVPQQRDPLRRVLGGLSRAWFGDPIREPGLFQACRTVAEICGVFREQVEAEVAAITALVEADAFDVIELRRVREFASVPDPRVVVADGSSLAIESCGSVRNSV